MSPAAKKKPTKKAASKKKAAPPPDPVMPDAEPEVKEQKVKKDSLADIAATAWRLSRQIGADEWDSVGESESPERKPWDAYHRLWQGRLIRFAVHFYVECQKRGIDPTRH